MKVRKYKPDEINLEINNFIPFENEKYEGVTIQWDSDIGFGEYIIYKVNGSDEWIADSERMDCNEDKAFIEELMKLFIAKLNIEN